MAFSSSRDGASAGGADAVVSASPHEDWAEPGKPPRDWKKLTLVIGLGILSWVATYVGMLELIEANMGELPLVHKVIIGFSVGMLMTMIIWLLDQLFAPIGLTTKLIYAAGYVFLTIISVGFGFGFYWKVLESRSESSRSAESAVTQVQSSLHAASTRLEQLQSTLVQLTQISAQKAELERASGTSCPNSKPGDGPRRKLREDDAARFGFASEFVKGRVGAVKADMSALDVELARLAKDDKSLVDSKSGTRNDFMRSLSRKLDMTVTGFNAFRTDPQLKQIRLDLAERAEKVTFPDTKGATYVCPDPQLQTALRGVVRAIDQLPELEKPKVAAVEGSEATIEAFRRLTATFYGALSFKMPPSADELRHLQQKAVQSVEQAGAQAQAARQAALGEQVGLSKRDYIPLAIALFVDLCLLLVSMGRPVNHLGGLVPKMRAAEQGPVYQILARFNDIHRDAETREKFEIFRHVVFDFNGDYYVAVPLDAPYRVRKGRGEPVGGRDYTEAVKELQMEAHLLSNLFASFEKERIFSRVYSPFLTTRTIQRKLWRQGSKFAGSTAFRVYRFRDGAWSEIILGAVMGAARRVESDRRRRQIEEASRPPAAAQPELPRPIPARPPQKAGRSAVAAMPAPGNRPAEPSYARNSYEFGVIDGLERPQRNTSPAQATRAQLPPVSEELEAQYGPYARSVAAHGRYESPRSKRVAPSANYRETAAALDAVASARQQVREAEVVVRAANSNAMPPLERMSAPASEAVAANPAAVVVANPPSVPDNVVPLPRSASISRATEPLAAVPLEPAAASHPGGIDVTLRRETATFTVPVTEAALPPGLAQLLGQAVVHSQVVLKSDVLMESAPEKSGELLPAPSAAGTTIGTRALAIAGETETRELPAIEGAIPTSSAHDRRD